MAGRGKEFVLACLLVVAGLLALAPAASALTRPRSFAGAALHPWRLETRTYAPLWPLRDDVLRDRSFAKLQAAGIRYARIDLKWSSVMPYGRTVHDWSEFDATVASARFHHIQLEPIVAFTPSWANGGAGPFAYPKHPDDFQDFMTAAMSRYPDIRTWEIWNEPNSRLFSPPRPDPAKFVAMLKAASRARFWAGSHARIVTGGLAPRADMEIAEFAEKIAKLGAFRYANALGVHPYSQQGPDHDGSTFLRLPKLHTEVSRAAGRPVDFWVTEYGYPNSEVRSEYGPPASEKTQAGRLQKAFALAVGWPWLKRLTWYGFRDDCDDGHHPDCRFGLLRTNFAPKLVWYGYQQVLAGNLPMLDTRITLRRKSRVVRRRGRRKRVHTLTGTLLMPGTDPARGSVLVTATRRYKGRKRRRRITASLSDGRYRVSLGRLRRGRWRFRTEFKGNSRYTGSLSRSLSLRVRR